MKGVLLSLLFFLFVVCINKLSAQCTIQQSSVIVSVKSVTTNVTGCETIFDLTFDIAGNGGNKWSHIHLWDANAYPSIVYGNGTGPNKSMLNGGTGTPAPKPLLATVSLDYQNGVDVVSITYPADNSVPVQTSGVTYTRTPISGGLTRFAITNIKVQTTICTPIDLKADVWSAQDNNGKNIACAVTGLSVRADEPLLRGTLVCSNPRTLTLSIYTKENRSVDVIGYRDVTPLGVFDENDQSANNIVYSNTFNTIGDPNPADGMNYNNYGPLEYTGGAAAGNNFSIWIVASTIGIHNASSILIDNTCAPLPVTFSNFHAQRNHEKVSLKWETLSEQNNRGFNVQRNTRGVWETIAFVFSQADGGNSDELLSYEFKDPNSEKGVSQYRIQQVDFDGKASYSAIRSVKGLEQAGTRTVVYPNPSSDGKVSVVFEDQGAKAVTVSDMSGRVIRQFRNVLNNVQIEGLESGMYSIQITDLSSAVSSTEKVIIKKR